MPRVLQRQGLTSYADSVSSAKQSCTKGVVSLTLNEPRFCNDGRQKYEETVQAAHLFLDEVDYVCSGLEELNEENHTFYKVIVDASKHVACSSNTMINGIIGDEYLEIATC